METDGNSMRQCESVIGVTKNRLRLGVVDAVLWDFTNSSSFKIIWVSHEVGVHGIQLVLISEVSFYFAERKGETIDVQTIQSLYCSFILQTTSSNLLTKYFVPYILYKRNFYNLVYHSISHT
jgi:hypothetical protein